MWLVVVRTSTSRLPTTAELPGMMSIEPLRGSDSVSRDPLAFDSIVQGIYWGKVMELDVVLFDGKEMLGVSADIYT